MKTIVQQADKFIKNKSLLISISQVIGSQLLIRVMGLVIGFILIRILSKNDYALYTILITIQGMLIPLSNSSTFIGFKKIGGEIWDNDKKLSSLIKTADSISNYIIAIAFLLVGGYATFILLEQEIEFQSIIWFLACVLLIVIPDVKTSFLRNALLFQKKIKVVQVTEVIGHIPRFIILAFFFIILKDEITISIILLITIFSTWISYIYIQKQSKNLRFLNPVISKNYKETLIKYIKLNWHNSAFYTFKGQISIFLIGVFGTTDSIADIGALTRFTLIFMMGKSLVDNIYSPAFGRCQNQEELKVLFRNAIAIIFLTSAAMLITVYLFPNQILWILGPKYEHLSYELFLVFLIGSLNLLLGTVYALNLTKGWIKYTPTYEIPIDVITLIFGVLVFNISELMGVLYLSLLSSFSNLLLHLFNSRHGLKYAEVN
ncbi:MAG: hypothetical protein R6V72_21410 [Cyclobacterium sp.]|uniref:lipopolysaccharide biosynthesis protein n=1 Tax=Cyclobacterium sp. TaxID=1966343 RepID=UPI003970FAFA